MPTKASTAKAKADPAPRASAKRAQAPAPVTVTAKAAKAAKARQESKADAAAPRTARPRQADKALAAAKPAKADKPADKAKKPKLVRDSFTIPKTEYAVLDELKARAAKLGKPAKKSEVLRAGVKALAAMSDEAFLAAIGAVEAIKTGRPAKVS